jgi:carboxymethylenebutenolidase
MGQTIQLSAADGQQIPAYVAQPQGRAKGAVVVIQEIFGVNDHIRWVAAQQYAAAGYLAVAPAFFDRIESGVELGYTPEGTARGRTLVDELGLDAPLRDIRAAQQQVANGLPTGVVGYCWGGLITWLAAANLSGLAAAVPYYGGGILDNANLEPKVPLMAHFGERDAHIPAEDVKKLAAKHSKHQIFIYAADHGFNCDHRGSYDAPTAKQARERTLAFFREHVG